jgi:hypothetical protein
MHADANPHGPLTQMPGSAAACPGSATANTTGTATAPNPAAAFSRIPDQVITHLNPSRPIYENIPVRTDWNPSAGNFSTHCRANQGTETSISARAELVLS